MVEIDINEVRAIRESYSYSLTEAKRYIIKRELLTRFWELEDEQVLDPRLLDILKVLIDDYHSPYG